MVKIYRSARGEQVDFDKLRMANETAIAVGNMKTNARGDELGPGGKIVKTRAQIMQDYHKLNTPMASDAPVLDSIPAVAQILKPTPIDPSISDPLYVKPRGSLADAVAQDTSIAIKKT